MTASASAADAAWRLWARAAAGARSPDEVGAAAERVCGQLLTGLSRWIGSEGYRALLGRALVSVQGQHPALHGVPCLEGDEPGTKADIGANDATRVAAGMVALVTALIELLSRIIGEEMAVTLVEQTGKPGPRAAVSTSGKEGRDG